MGWNRFKETGGVTSSSGNVYKVNNCATCALSVAGSWTNVTDVNYKYTRGENIPKYHSRLKRGELLPLTLFEQWEEIGNCRCYYDFHLSTCGTCGTYQTCDTPNGYFTSWRITEQQLKDVADQYDPHRFVQFAAAKAYGNGWDVLTFAVELRKTVDMLRSFGLKLYRITKSGKVRYSANTGNHAWLEGRYGWRQLIFDMQDIIKLVNSLNEQRTRVKESSGVTETFSESSVVSTYDWQAAYFEVTRTNTYSVGLRGTIVADFEPPKIHLNPIKTSWEAIPFSFVVDWFYQVGKWIDAMSFLTFTSKYHAAQGIHIECNTVCSITTNNWKTNFSGTNEVSAINTAKYTLRTPTSVALTPYFQLRIDSFKVADLGALIAQAVLRRK